MGEILSINPHQARMEPEAEFESPRALELDSALTRGQKIATLDRWAADVEARLSAASEGMLGGTGSQTNDADLLKLIGESRQRLTAKDHTTSPACADQD